MKPGIIIACMASIAAVSLPMQASACTSEELTAQVKQIGIAHGDDFAWQPVFNCFVAHGAEAAGLLVQELHPVPDPVIRADLTAKYPETMHVVWVLRGLYYMTGTIFRAGSVDELKKRHLPEEREYWLAFHSKYHDSQVNLFQIWDSRGTLYIAPKDIQAAGIGKWKQWYAENGARFHYAAHDEHRGMWYEGYDDREPDLGPE